MPGCSCSRREVGSKSRRPCACAWGWRKRLENIRKEEKNEFEKWKKWWKEKKKCQTLRTVRQID